MEKNYKISVNFSDGSFEIESTDFKWIERKEKEYLRKFGSLPPKKVRDSEAVGGKERTSVHFSKTLPPQLAINEFYKKYVSTIKSRPIIGVFLLYYLQKIKKQDEIETTDIQQCFKAVAYPNWNRLNITDILTRAKRRALVNYVNKQWSLTATGEDFVLNAISGK